MARETGEAPEVVRRGLVANRRTLRELGATLRERAPRMVLTCGRGSSDHAATYAKYLIETRTGVLTSSAAPSISSVYDTRSDMSEVLCLAISQSGRSPDLLASVQAAKAGGAYVVALVNVEDSPLAALAHAVAPLHAGAERSVAATKSFLASLAAIAQLTAEWTQDAELVSALDRAPEAMARAAALDWSAAVERLTPARNLYVVGRGLGFGAAQEAALKFKETCGLHAEAFSSAEVRHGPMALVGPDFPVMAFTQDDATREGVETLVDDLTADGAPVLLAGRPHATAITLPVVESAAALQPLMSIQSFYPMAERLSRARGFDPDHPPHLRKVTKTV
ncbi:MAG: SIS domain-containing protein [Proteobacteria bacterium]|nr:SIS domain-containing protein [Pseudomonadota bacterium]